MEEFINLLAKAIVETDTFRDAVRDIVMGAYEELEVITKTDLADTVAEEFRSIKLDIESQVTDAVEEAIKDADIPEACAEAIEEYFRYGPKFTISIG